MCRLRHRRQIFFAVPLPLTKFYTAIGLCHSCNEDPSTCDRINAYFVVSVMFTISSPDDLYVFTVDIFTVAVFSYLRGHF